MQTQKIPGTRFRLRDFTDQETNPKRGDQNRPLSAFNGPLTCILLVLFFPVVVSSVSLCVVLTCFHRAGPISRRTLLLILFPALRLRLPSALRILCADVLTRLLTFTLAGNRNPAL